MTEHQTVEYKQIWKDAYLKWICGFANAQGGVLVIGRDDAGEAVGVAHAGKLLEDIPNKVRDILGIMVAVRLLQEEGKTLLEIVVDAYPSPINYKGEYYFRSGSTNQLLKGAALDRFLLRKYGRTWDGSPLPGLKAIDLDSRAFDQFRKLALKSKRLPEAVVKEDNRHLLEKLHLVNGDYLTHAAALLFYAEPERLIGGAYVKIGYFENDADLRYQDEAQGCLLAQVNQAVDILHAKYLRAWISYEGLQRIETFPVPEAALREAVLNAVVHKDYASSIPIQISVYPDKLMIWNPGELPPNWTVEKLLAKHASQPFNPDVANVFFRAGLIESWGRGIERIMQACANAGVPTPEVSSDVNGLWMTFRFLHEHQMHPAHDEEGSTTQKTTQETTQEKIIRQIKLNPSITQKGLSEQTGISVDGVKYHLKKLKDAGMIKRLGSTKAGRWEVLT
jgi:ATP-dependent DNA helicase RecG